MPLFKQTLDLPPGPKGKHDAFREAATMQCISEVRSVLGRVHAFLAPYMPRPILDAEGKRWTVLAYPFGDGVVNEVARIYRPWDCYSKVGVGERGEDGRYASYTYKIYPGNFGGVIPAGMFAALTLSAASTYYIAVTATMDNSGVRSCSIASSGSHPAPQDQTMDGPPTMLEWVVAMVVQGTYFNVATKNLEVLPVESFREDNPDATPFSLPYKSYYLWKVT